QQKRAGADVSRVEPARLRQETAYRAANISGLLESLSESIALLEGKPWNDKQRFVDSLALEVNTVALEPNEDVQVALHRMFPSDDRKAFGEKPLVTIAIKEDAAATADITPSLTSPRVVRRAPVFADRIRISQTSTVVNQRLLLPDGIYRVEAVLESGGEVVARLRKPIFAISDFTEKLEGLVALLNTIRGSTDPNAKSRAEQLATIEFQIQRLAGINEAHGENLDPIAELRRLEEVLAAVSGGSNPLATARGQVEKACRSADGRLLPYRVYLPKSYDGKTPAPMVVLLHDALVDERAYLSEIYGGSTIAAEAEKRGFVLVAPGAGGIFPTYRGKSQEDVFEVIRAAMQEYAVDPGRIYVTGHSAGAFGTWAIASQRPEMFAAIAPVSGGFVLAQNDQTAIFSKVSDVPVLVVHGGRDGIAPPKLSRELSNSARKAGLRVEYLESADADHFSVVSTTFSQILDFFQKNRKAPKPEQSK
ncbi:MAG TPA: prolyl oligopeptidase family serine peptidase, partial [Blastocatellia bacterium]|nr:prolyl oligopeptidase family serine peptidase [Blastocatellia bacterium]